MAILNIQAAALVQNWRMLAKKVSPAHCGAVVKANAYGLGAVRVTQHLYQAGCRLFFTAKAYEALEIRPHAPEADIVVLHGIEPQDAQSAQAARLTPVISHAAHLFWQGPFWLGVDSGMNRLGFSPSDLPHLAGRTPQVVMSHLACADEPQHHKNTEQLKLFREVMRGYVGVSSSLAASSGIFLGQSFWGDIVRPGFALYGGNPTPTQANPMQPVILWQAPVRAVRELETGETAGYGATWQADRPTRLAVVELGYADGLPRGLSSAGGQAMLAGSRVNIIGRVSMDLVQLDITDLPETAVQAGDMAEFLGSQITIDEMATKAGMIHYEVMTGLKAFRVYQAGGF